MMTRSLLFIAALSPPNHENIQTDGDEKNNRGGKELNGLAGKRARREGSFPFSLSTNCPASSGILKTLCQGKTGFEQTLRNSDVSRFDGGGGEGGALLILKGLSKFCSSMRSFLPRRPPRQTLEKSQFLIDSFCRCVIDWASCGEVERGRREEW